MFASSSRSSLKRAPPRIGPAIQCNATGAVARPFLERLQRRHASSVVQQSPHGAKPEVNAAPRAGLRSQPWQFKPDSSHQTTMNRTSQARYTMKIMDYADHGRYSNCLEVASQMKLAGIQPDLNTYNSLLSSAAQGGSWLDAWAILDDMLLAGVKPTTPSFNSVIQAQRHRSSPYVWQVIEKMNELGVPPNSATFTLLIQRFAAAGNMELALQYFYAMKEQGLVPELKASQSVITLVANHGYSRLAIDLADWFERRSTRRLDHTVWMNCLISSADNLYEEGVVRCWKIIQDLNLSPDEGLCVSVLHTAARHGLPDLATDALRILKVIGASWQEYHFAPLIEAFSRAGKLKEAIMTLEIMRANGIEPVAETTRSIFTTINRDTDVLDNTWAIIEALHQEKKTIDVAALKVIIEAAVSLGDLQRAIGTYKSFSEYGVQPDLATYNHLLEGCISARHRQLGDLLLTDMKEAKIKPNHETYQNLIKLCLTQPTYEDAFFYLEEMKAAGHVPPRHVYEALVQTCFSSGDPRYTIALEEMKECGYELSPRLMAHIRAAVRRGAQIAETPKPQLELLDGAAQRFIETGGLSDVGEKEKET